MFFKEIKNKKILDATNLSPGYLPKKRKKEIVTKLPGVLQFSINYIPLQNSTTTGS